MNSLINLENITINMKIVPKKIITEIFFANYGSNKYLMFVPRRKSLLLIINKRTRDIIKNFDKYKKSHDKDVIALLKFLGKKRIIGYFSDPQISCDKIKDFAPNRMTIIPTLDCNLRCVYCYAKGGDKKNHIDPDLAKKSVELLIEKLKRRGKKETEIMFHGGGEPFLNSNWDFLVEFVAYVEKRAKEENIKINLSGVTNGCMSKEQAHYIIAHFRDITISMDGPKEFHDKQRLYLNKEGKLEGSFERVMSTIKEFDKHNFSYGFRVTLSKSAFEKFGDVVDFFMNETKATGINIEPIYTWGRQLKSGVEGPDIKKFAKELVNQKFRAAKNKFSIGCGLLSFNKLKTSWCETCGRTFCVTPENIVTSCLEVCHKDDPRSKVFQYGHYDDSKKEFVFDIEKLKILGKRNVNNLLKCQECIAKYFCAGGCVAKMNTLDIFDIDKSQTCEMNKLIIEEYLKRLAKEKDKDVLNFLSVNNAFEDHPAY